MKPSSSSETSRSACRCCAPGVAPSLPPSHPSSEPGFPPSQKPKLSTIKYDLKHQRHCKFSLCIAFPRTGPAARNCLDDSGLHRLHPSTWRRFLLPLACHPRCWQPMFLATQAPHCPLQASSQQFATRLLSRSPLCRTCLDPVSTPSSPDRLGHHPRPPPPAALWWLGNPSRQQLVEQHS